MISALEIAGVVNRARPKLKRITPTAEQVAVIEAPLQPTLVVAGAGSGKTATMADRVVWLVVNGHARPDEILGLTFTRKAAGELAERVRTNLRRARDAGLFSLDALDTTTSTYNSFAASVVRDHALRVSRDPDSALITGAGSRQLMDEVVRTWWGPLATDRSPQTVSGMAVQLAEELRSHLVSVDDVVAYMELELPELRRIAAGEAPSKASLEAITASVAASEERLALLGLIEEYLRIMRERGLLSYADQVAIACEIANGVPAVGELMRTQYKAVLLDEFQDTSVAQLQFLLDLFGPGFPAMAVGDPNQAIYGWRGASASSLVLFKEGFSTPGSQTQVRHLTTSWRNDRAILQAANVTSEPLENDSSGASDLLMPLAAREGAGAGEVHRSVSLTEEEEAAEIARWVESRWVPGTVTAAVLCRTGGQFTALLRAFRERGIEPEVVGLKGLLSAPEIIDLRAALEVASDATRGDSMMRLLTNERLGLTDLHVLSEWATRLAGEDARGDADVSAAIVEAVADPPPPSFVTRAGHRLSGEGRVRLERLAAQLRDIRAAMSYPLTDLVATAERALLLDIEVAARPIAPATARAKLDAFAGHAASYSAGVLAPSVAGFLSWLTAADEDERGFELPATGVDENSVHILTVHAAKGLEWDLVAVAGLTEGTFPHRRNSGGSLAKSEKSWLRSAEMLPWPLRGDSKYLPQFTSDADTPPEFATDVAAFEAETFEYSMSEERRLAYVAVTRARKAVLLSGSHYRSGKMPLEISRFLTELEDASVIPEGFQVVPPPPPKTPAPEDTTQEVVSYPGTDPLVAGDVGAHQDGGTSRRARLTAAVAAVNQTREELRARGTDLQENWDEILSIFAATVTSDADLALIEDVRVLLREAESRRSPVTVEMPRQMSASATLAFTADPAAYALDLRRPVPREPSPAASLGSEFHAWVEHHFGSPSFDLGDEDEGPEGSAEQLAELKEAFLRSTWALRSPLAIEIPLEVEIAGQIIRCRIDAVFEVDGTTTVVDWKTGRPPATAQETDQRRLQLEIYRLAYARAFEVPLAEVAAAFHYVASGVTAESGMLTEAEIVNRVAHARELAFEG